MGLLDLITGGKSSDATAAMDRALAAIQGVKTPNIKDMEYQIQKLVQAGVLSPEQAKTFLQNPNAMLGQQISQTGTNAQERAIADLLGAAEQGGLNPVEQAKISQIISQLGTAERGANEAILQRQAERGALTGGETLAAQLMANQGAAANANQLGLGTAGEAYQNMLNELTSAGGMGAGLQGQQNQQSNTVAAATNAINQFNAAQQQTQENFNVGNRNAAQAYNVENLQNIGNQNVANQNEYARYQAQLPEQVFQNEMAKANAISGVGQQQANLATQQGGQQAALIGGLIGAGGQALTGGMSKAPVYNVYGGAPKAAHGGEIHNYLGGGQVDGRANVPGDSEKNDIVPSLLSPKEIVIPRSVAIPAMNGEISPVISFLNRIRQKKEPTPIHPHDVKSVLDALSLRRI